MSRSSDEPNLSQDLRSALLKLGLSDSESRAYVRLLTDGHLTAMEISRRAGVPYSKIYDVLRKLEERGWVVAQEGSRPTVFAARHPREAMEIWRSIREREARMYEEEALEELEKLMPGAIQERHDVWIARGVEAAVANAVSILSRCEEDVLIALPEELSDGLDEMLTSLAGARGRIMVMAPNQGVADRVRERLPGAAVRVKGEMFGGGVICGMSSVALLLGEEERGKPYITIMSEHPGLALLARSYFEHLWSLAGDGD